MTTETTHSASPIPGDIPVSEIVRPTRPEEISDILRAASEAGRPVLPFGGGTSLATGNYVTEPFLGIDLRGLSGVRDYQPADLTASFWAGTPLHEVIAELGERGQELPVDMPQSGQATIGGLVATGFAGPRRLGSGTLKDLIIGCSYVRGDGLAAKAGGMLVKNVSGFEIPRLLHGSWGALALITSINVKVTPKPKADVTVSRRFANLGEALGAQMGLIQGHPTIAACVVERDADGWVLYARLLGRAASLQAQLRAIESDLGTDVSEAEGDEFWRSYNQRWAETGDDVHVVIGSQPRAMASIAEAMSSLSGLRAMMVSIGSGSLRFRLDAGAMTPAELDQRMRSHAKGHPLHWVVESAPADWKGTASVWGPAADGMGLMRAIKQEFDPAGILNRGRLFIENR